MLVKFQSWRLSCIRNWINSLKMMASDVAGDNNRLGNKLFGLCNYFVQFQYVMSSLIFRRINCQYCCIQKVRRRSISWWQASTSAQSSWGKVRDTNRTEATYTKRCRKNWIRHTNILRSVEKTRTSWSQGKQIWLKQTCHVQLSGRWPHRCHWYLS